MSSTARPQDSEVAFPRSLNTGCRQSSRCARRSAPRSHGPVPQRARRRIGMPSKSNPDLLAFVCAGAASGQGGRPTARVSNRCSLAFPACRDALRAAAGLHPTCSPCDAAFREDGMAGPREPGQSAFTAIQEMVALLKADPQTDWSRVDVEALHSTSSTWTTSRSACR